MALRGTKVIEIVGLAPAPLCGLILSDFGANVIRVDRPYEPQPDCLIRGKRSVAIDLKNDGGKNIFRLLCDTADVLIEPFRAGVMERLDLGPDNLMRTNKGLIYARLSGFGQSGKLAQRAGHDINYLAISGVLSRLGEIRQPSPPINLLGDFAGGGLTCALGICLALLERHRSGQGQVVDSNIVEGVRYVSTWLWQSMNVNQNVAGLVWPNPLKRGYNTLDGAAPFYCCYETKDGKFMAVGALEPKFYIKFAQLINIDPETYSQYDIARWDEMKTKFAEIFGTKTQEEWSKIFEGQDACVSPVIDFQDTEIAARQFDTDSFLADGTPKPAPNLSRTPAKPSLVQNSQAQDTKEVLLELGYSSEEIETFSENGIIQTNENFKSHL